jgi:hypothetical protein
LNDGAYYLAGYAVECGLKACIAKRILRHDFPDRDLVQGLYTRAPLALLVKARLFDELEAHAAADLLFRANWNVARQWTPESRYNLHGRDEADLLITAVGDSRSGVLAWLSEYEEWRLVLASRRLDKEDTRRRYELVNAATDAAGIGIRRAPDLLILKTTDPFIRELRRLYAKSKNAEGMRLGGYTIGNRGIRDGWVYRIS